MYIRYLQSTDLLTLASIHTHIYIYIYVIYLSQLCIHVGIDSLFCHSILLPLNSRIFNCQSSYSFLHGLLILLLKFLTAKAKKKRKKERNDDDNEKNSGTTT